MAKRVKAPLPIVERRRRALRRSVRAYRIDMSLFGWRIADLFIEIEHGDPYLIAQNIMGHRART